MLLVFLMIIWFVWFIPYLEFFIFFVGAAGGRTNDGRYGGHKSFDQHDKNHSFVMLIKGAFLTNQIEFMTWKRISCSIFLKIKFPMTPLEFMSDSWISDSFLSDSFLSDFRMKLHFGYTPPT